MRTTDFKINFAGLIIHVSAFGANDAVILACAKQINAGMDYRNITSVEFKNYGSDNWKELSLAGISIIADGLG